MNICLGSKACIFLCRYRFLCSAQVIHWNFGPFLIFFMDILQWRPSPSVGSSFYGLNLKLRLVAHLFRFMKLSSIYQSVLENTKRSVETVQRPTSLITANDSLWSCRGLSMLLWFELTDASWKVFSWRWLSSSLNCWVGSTSFRAQRGPSLTGDVDSLAVLWFA